MFGPIYELSKFHVIYANENLQRANKISKGQLILGYMHVFEWDIRRCPI